MFYKLTTPEGTLTRAFIKSTNIQAYPCGRRRSSLIDTNGSDDTVSDGYYIPFDPEARLNTEANNIKTSGISGFAQTYLNSWTSEVDSDSSDDILSLVLGGYKFDINLCDRQDGTDGINYTKYKTAAAFGRGIEEALTAAANGTKIYANIRTEAVQLLVTYFKAYNTMVLRNQTKNDSTGTANLNLPEVNLDLLSGGDINEAANYYFSGLSFSYEPLTDEQHALVTPNYMPGDGGYVSNEREYLYEVAGTDARTVATIYVKPETTETADALFPSTTKKPPNEVYQQVTSLCLLEKVDGEWKVYEPARLPKVEHDLTENSVKVGELHTTLDTNIDGDLAVGGKATIADKLDVNGENSTNTFKGHVKIEKTVIIGTETDTEATEDEIDLIVHGGSIINGSLCVEEDTTINAPLIVNSTAIMDFASIFNDLQVGHPHSIPPDYEGEAGDIYAAGNITAGNNITADYDITAGTNITASVDATVGNKLTVNGTDEPSTFKGKVNIEKTVTIGTDNNTDPDTPDLIVKGDGVINADLHVYENAEVVGTTTLTKKVTVQTEGITVTEGGVEVKADGIKVKDGVTVETGDVKVQEGSITVKNGITVETTGITVEDGGITVNKGDIAVKNGGIKVELARDVDARKSNTYVKSLLAGITDVTQYETETGGFITAEDAGSKIFAKGDIKTQGTLVVGDAEYSASPGSIFAAGDINASGSLTVQGNATIKQGLEVHELHVKANSTEDEDCDVVFDGDLQVKGSTMLDGGATVDTSLVVNGLTELDQTIIEKDLRVGPINILPSEYEGEDGDIYATGNITAGNDIVAGNNITAENTISATTVDATTIYAEQIMYNNAPILQPTVVSLGDDKYQLQFVPCISASN